MGILPFWTDFYFGALRFVNRFCVRDADRYFCLQISRNVRHSTLRTVHTSYLSLARCSIGKENCKETYGKRHYFYQIFNYSIFDEVKLRHLFFKYMCFLCRSMCNIYILMCNIYISICNIYTYMVKYQHKTNDTRSESRFQCNAVDTVEWKMVSSVK